MSYSIKTVPSFDKQAKQIAKKHKSFKYDLTTLINQLAENPKTGIHLGQNVYKIRLALSDTNKGKSGGARVITCVAVVTETVYLAEIYLKSEQSTVALQEVLKRLESAGISFS